MEIQCRPMKVSDFGVVECAHWESADQIRRYVENQGIAPLLAFDADRYLGQLYLQEYDPQFRDPGGWVGDRPWADFQVAEPLGLSGRFLTLGCYHVGWMPDGSRDGSLYGRGIGTALLRAVMAWYEAQEIIDGLLTWALVPGYTELLQNAGQMPYTVYERLGFREIKRLDDPRWTEAVACLERTGPEEDPAVLRVMLLRKKGTPISLRFVKS